MLDFISQMMTKSSYIQVCFIFEILYQTISLESSNILYVLNNSFFKIIYLDLRENQGYERYSTLLPKNYTNHRKKHETKILRKRNIYFIAQMH